MNDRDYLVEKTGGKSVIELIRPPAAAPVTNADMLGRATTVLEIFGNRWPSTN